MQNTEPNRKRPAPGASPMMQQPAAQQNYQYPQMTDNTNYPNYDFSNSLPPDQKYSDPSAYDTNNYNAYGLNHAQPQTYGVNVGPMQPSTELVRRTRNQQLAPQNGQQEQWSNVQGMGPPVYDEDDAELERRAEIAKTEGQAKRKQIPPFIQKLSR